MSDDPNPATNPKLRRFAELEVERQSAAVDRILDQHIADFRWLTASLLVLNSSAAAAVLNSSYVSIQGKTFSSLLFVIGIALALLVGVASQRLSRRTLPPTIGYRAFWIAVSQGELFDAEAERAAIDKILRSAKRGWFVPLLGWLSALAFLAGWAASALNLEPVARPTKSDQAATL